MENKIEKSSTLFRHYRKSSENINIFVSEVINKFNNNELINKAMICYKLLLKNRYIEKDTFNIFYYVKHLTKTTKSVILYSNLKINEKNKTFIEDEMKTTKMVKEVIMKRELDSKFYPKIYCLNINGKYFSLIPLERLLKL